MKIAITADIHLTSPSRHPERFHAFQSILDQMIYKNIRILIVAGDLFDETSNNYSDFENILKKPEYKDLEIYIIPGNHDLYLSRKHFALSEQPKLEIISTPKVVQVDQSSNKSFLFVPYQKNKTMGEIISNHIDELTPEDWLLVAHGDWLESQNSPNKIESGIYMPLTRRDLELFRPSKVFLGHIHLPWGREPVYYPGSPCGLDITESGLRSYLIYDTLSGKVEKAIIETDVVYCDANIIVLPLPNELNLVRAQIDDILKNFDDTKPDNVYIRLKAQGGSTNKEELMKVINQALEGYVLYEGSSPNLDQVEIAESSDLVALAQEVTNRISSLPIDSNIDEPSRDEILTAAFQIIFGGRHVNSH